MNILNIFKKRKEADSLERFRDRNKLTNRDLARLLGVSESYISHYFNGKRTFGASIAIRISDKTGIPMRELYQ